MHTDERHAAVIKNAVSILKSEPYNQYIDAVYLFGSCARGTNKYCSDIDLLIQGNVKLRPAIARLLRVAIMPEDCNLPEIDLKFVNGMNWKNSSDQFTHNLLKEGILLWKKQ